MSETPLHETLADLLRRRGTTLSGVAALLRAEGLTIGRTRLSQIAAGQGPPVSAAHLERLAQVLGVSPSHFAEYRLWRVRSLLDPAMVGFDRAMDNMSRLNGRRTEPRITEPRIEPPLADTPGSEGNGAASYPGAISRAKERA